MTLKDYFTKHCVNITKWCKKHDISRKTIHSILRGMIPTVQLGIKIYRATNREVTLKDLGVEI